MAKIVIDARELRTSTGRYIERLIHHLQQIDTEHDYVILLRAKDIDGWEPTNPRFAKVMTPYKEFTFGEQLGFKRQIESLQPDLVHFGMVQQPVLYKGKVVTTMHDLTTIRFNNPAKNPIVFWVKLQVYKWVTKSVARKSLAVITDTDYVKQDVIKYTGADSSKFVVTYLAADTTDEAAMPVEKLVNANFIMYVGRPQPHKNLKRLIDAFGILQKLHPELSLVLAGKFDANYQLLKNYSDKKNIPNVIYTGFISDGQLRWLYEHAACYAFPSLSEGFGLPGLEAMVHGCPVASSNATCLPEVYKDGAAYFNPFDVSGMAETIDVILTDKKFADGLRAKGKAVAAQYSWKRMAEQTLAVYNDVLRSK